MKPIVLKKLICPDAKYQKPAFDQRSKFSTASKQTNFNNTIKNASSKKIPLINSQPELLKVAHIKTEELKSKLSAKDEEIKDLKDYLGENNALLSKYNDEIASLQKTITELKKKNNVLETKNNVLETKKEKLKTDLENSKKEKENLNSIILELKNELKRKENLEKKLNERKLALKKSKGENKANLLKINELSSRNDELDKMIKMMMNSEEFDKKFEKERKNLSTPRSGNIVYKKKG